MRLTKRSINSHPPYTRIFFQNAKSQSRKVYLCVSTALRFVVTAHCRPSISHSGMGFGRELQGNCKGVKSEELIVNNLSLYLLRWAVRRMAFFTLRSSLIFRSWPLIGKRDLNSSLFTLHLFGCKGTTFFSENHKVACFFHVTFQEIAFYTRNSLIHREKFSEGIFSVSTLPVISH